MTLSYPQVRLKLSTSTEKISFLGPKTQKILKPVATFSQTGCQVIESIASAATITPVFFIVPSTVQLVLAAKWQLARSIAEDGDSVVSPVQRFLR
jgi:hypothetical protein